MKFQKLFLAIGISTAALLTISASGAGKKEEPIHVSELMNQHPIGLLGKPLGERLVVEGQMAKYGMLSGPLAIAEVDGHAMATPVAMEISGAEIKKGIHYKLEGYESGAFGGYPGWFRPEAQQPFQYHPSFVVTRVIEPAGKK